MAGWSDHPQALLEAAIEWLIAQDRNSPLARRVAGTTSAHQFLKQNLPGNYEHALKAEVESAGRQVSDLKMALADQVILRSFNCLKYEHEAEALGLSTRTGRLEMI